MKQLSVENIMETSLRTAWQDRDALLIDRGQQIHRLEELTARNLQSLQSVLPERGAPSGRSSASPCRGMAAWLEVPVDSIMDGLTPLQSKLCLRAAHLHCF